MNNIIGIPPRQFIHVLDLNTNITHLETGPSTVVLKSHERLEANPLPMIVIPPGYYCIVCDPVKKYEKRKVCELHLGQTVVKFHKEPFPLYPGESLSGAPNFRRDSDFWKAVKLLPVIEANCAIRLKAILDHNDAGTTRQAGDMWQLEGPLSYKPTPFAEILGIIKPTVIRDGACVKLVAKEDFVDRNGRKRVTKEEWFVYQPGAYLPGVFEEVEGVEQKMTLTRDNALHLRATQTLIDFQGKKRLAGEEWLLTGEQTDEYYPEIGVEVLKVENKTVVGEGQYCVVVNPLDKDTGKPHLGKEEMREGLVSFFLHPGEALKNGLQDAYILGEDESLVLLAVKELVDTVVRTEIVIEAPKPSKGKKQVPVPVQQKVTQKRVKIKRRAGDRWMITGPMEYIPPIEVTVVKKRKKIPLGDNEGIYIQNVQTGAVRVVMGPQAYMLAAEEELWEKDLSPVVEDMLKKGGGTGSDEIRKMAYFEQSIDPAILKGRNRTRVVTYRCPGNTAVQVYNYVDKTARVVFGPDLVILGPQESFNVLTLSAGKPKKPDALKTLCLMLGPDFITDILELETSDHARLRIEVAFNNHFVYKPGNEASEKKIFAVPDFIGFASRQIGGYIRAAVAQIPFDQFHKHSAQVIKTAVFGTDHIGTVEKQPFVKFDVNNLVITSIDIKSIEPVDVKMRDSLTKSVQQAIEITTKSVEAAAGHEAARGEQVARGQLERQKLISEMEVEKERAKLLELQAITAAVESSGQAKAEAQAHAEKLLIECESEIEAARLRSEAAEIEHSTRLEAQDMLKMNEIEYLKNINELELDRERRNADIEVNKFKDMVNAIGADVITAIAVSGPESQVKLLQSLGLDSVLITDGSNPINLFNTAEGLVSQPK